MKPSNESVCGEMRGRKVGGSLKERLPPSHIASAMRVEFVMGRLRISCTDRFLYGFSHLHVFELPNGLTLLY